MLHCIIRLCTHAVYTYRMSSSDSEGEGIPVEDYSSYKARIQAENKLRKDGKPFNEGNYRWGYKVYYRQAQRRAQETQRRRRQRRFERIQESREEEPEEGPSRKPATGESHFEEFLSAQQPSDQEIEEMTVNQSHEELPASRIRRETTAGNQTTAISGSSATGGINNDIRYISAAKAGMAHFAFEHVHLINTWGNAYKVATPGTEFKTKVMLTSLACLPVSAVCFWMSYAEYKNLPDGTRIVRVECIVTPKGFKTSFDTGTSITSSANNTQGVFGQCAVGLNNKLMIRNYEIERNTTAPMVIDNFNVPKTHDISERLWGHHMYDDNYDVSIPTCMGISRALKLYAGILQPYKDTDKNKQVSAGWPELNKHLKMYNYLDHIDIPVVHYHYDIKTNVLKAKQTQIDIDDAAHHECIMGGEDISLYKGKVDKEAFTITRINKLNSIKRTENSYDNYIKECVEQCHSVTILDHTPPNSGHAQPSLHIGILPIQSNAPDKELQEYVTACATWEVKTRIELVTDYNQDYIHNSLYGPNRTPFGSKPFGIGMMYNNSILGFAPSLN
ncbi:uncharacterized protein isoform X1 [Rhodnius prolixus]